VQYPPQLRLIEQRSDRSPSVVTEALELCLLLIDEAPGAIRCQRAAALLLLAGGHAASGVARD
jgi:hypothetical protein